MITAFAVFLKPFVAFLMIYCVAAPIKRYVERNLPHGLARRILFFSWRV